MVDKDVVNYLVEALEITSAEERFGAEIEKHTNVIPKERIPELLHDRGDYAAIDRSRVNFLLDLSVELCVQSMQIAHATRPISETQAVIDRSYKDFGENVNKEHLKTAQNNMLEYYKKFKKVNSDERKKLINNMPDMIVSRWKVDRVLKFFFLDNYTQIKIFLTLLDTKFPNGGYEPNDVIQYLSSLIYYHLLMASTAPPELNNAMYLVTSKVALLAGHMLATFNGVNERADAGIRGVKVRTDKGNELDKWIAHVFLRELDPEERKPPGTAVHKKIKNRLEVMASDSTEIANLIKGGVSYDRVRRALQECGEWPLKK
ncbi:hypothetical protein [Desulfoferula mesophila]|uniref:Uncharacterized protein n=1 Tax=Desulfoferula mesophila TaxID=3058419 RepID=A0AAU9F2W6_9BACT|nr:hypothetical protein FAK_30880 [Desulfoferula mesophilus]